MAQVKPSLFPWLVVALKYDELHESVHALVRLPPNEAAHDTDPAQLESSLSSHKFADAPFDGHAPALVFVLAS